MPLAGASSPSSHADIPLHLPEGGSYLKKQLSRCFWAMPAALLQTGGGPHSALSHVMSWGRGKAGEREALVQLR